MQVLQVVAPVFGTNCCVVVAGGSSADARQDAGPRRDCVVVDPGAGVAAEVSRLVERHGLRPRAVLATHGHVDHTWDAADLCARYDVPLRLHAADAYRLADPFGSLGLAADQGPGVSDALAAALAGTGRRPGDYRVPRHVETFDGTGGPVEVVAGAVRLAGVPAPGHTQGSTLFVLDDGTGPGPAVDGDAAAGTVLAGDVLFAGGVGRTDLPGGDAATMTRTLRDVVARLDPRLVVVPGHGPRTTVAHELATNPFLRRAAG